MSAKIGEYYPCETWGSQGNFSYKSFTALGGKRIFIVSDRCDVDKLFTKKMEGCFVFKENNKHTLDLYYFQDDKTRCTTLAVDSFKYMEQPRFSSIHDIHFKGLLLTEVVRALGLKTPLDLVELQRLERKRTELHATLSTLSPELQKFVAACDGSKQFRCELSQNKNWKFLTIHFNFQFEAIEGFIPQEVKESYEYWKKANGAVFCLQHPFDSFTALDEYFGSKAVEGQYYLRASSTNPELFTLVLKNSDRCSKIAIGYRVQDGLNLLFRTVNNKWFQLNQFIREQNCTAAIKPDLFTTGEEPPKKLAKK